VATGGFSPVLIGAAAAAQRGESPGDGVDCTALMIEAAQNAVADSGAPAAALASQIDLVLVTRGLSGLPDGANQIAAALGASDALGVAYEPGIPQQTLINRAIGAVRRGQARTVIVAGAETKHRDDSARRGGVSIEPDPRPSCGADELIRPEGEIVARPEIEVGAVVPAQQYALIENARRFANRWSLDAHRDDIASLWAQFNLVAQGNSAAAFASPMAAAEIRDPSPQNRPVAFPYNKWHNSQWGVDQAAALVICSASSARQLGVDPQACVHPHVALESSYSLSLSRRSELHRWPAMYVLGQVAASELDRPLSEIEHVELYSCFPAAVRVQQAELSLGEAAPATITGGMSFAGGPFNNFVFQATVAMVERLRRDPGSYGLVTAVSGLLTKPGLTVWNTDAPHDTTAECLGTDLAEEAAAATSVRELDEDPRGRGSIVSYTVTYGQSPAAGELPPPTRMIAIVDLDSGQRAVAASDDVEVAGRAVGDDMIGVSVSVDGRRFEI